MQEFCKFDDVERQVEVVECFPPVVDHLAQEGSVFVSPFDIRLALIPEDSLEVHVSQWRDHRVIKAYRLIVEEHHRRSLRHRRSLPVFPFSLKGYLFGSANYLIRFFRNE